MCDINSWDFKCGDGLWKALKSTGTCHSFIQDKYVGESAGVRSGFPESALELSTGRCWKRQPQMVWVHNYFSLKCGRIIRLMLGYCYSVHDLEIASWRLSGPPPGDLPAPGMEPRSPVLAVGFFIAESPRKPPAQLKNESLFFLLLIGCQYI